MRKEIFLPGLALTGGIAGFFLRRWQLSSAFEPDTGLPVSGAPATWALLALSFLMALVLLPLCRGRHGPFPGGYDEAFRCFSPLYAALTAAAGFLLGAGGILKLLELPAVLAEYLDPGLRSILAALPRLLLAFLCLASAVCVILTAKNNYRGEGRGTRSTLLLIPPFFSCMWLIAAYQERAADPVLMDYVYQLFAIIAVLLALYSMAGFSFEKAKVARSAYFSLLGVYLCGVALADSPDLSSLLLFVFAILYLTASASVLLGNDRNPAAQQKAEHPPEGGVS
jgi:hypothetical protein